MRTIAKVDVNQRKIVQALFNIGADVLHLHQLGGGAPDILVGFRGRNYLLEIKDGDKPPSRRKLTPREQQFFDFWPGQAAVVNNIAEALEIIGAVQAH